MKNNQAPLNPDALGRMFATAMMEVLDAEKLQPGDRLVHVNDIQEVLNRLEKNILTVAQPVAQKLTDAEWQAFQAIPDQGYSHRAWVDARIAERVAVAQPEVQANSKPNQNFEVVNSVEELDALPEGTVLLVTDKRPGVGKSSWELFSDVLELRDSGGELEPKAWASPAYTTEYTCKSLWEIADQINVLYRPEVKP